MTNDADQILNHLIESWHRWQLGDHGVKGHPSRALLIGDCRPQRVQYEGQLEKQDEEFEKGQSRAVDFAVSKMLEPYRSAIYCNARNLYTGREVWFSPRLPQDKAERLEVVCVARGQLVRLLISSGVM